MHSIIWLLPLAFCIGTSPASQLVPFKLKDNLVNVQAYINKKKISAVLDSGTGTIIVSEHYAVASGLVLGHPTLQAAGGGEGGQALFPIKINNVRIGPIRLSNVSGYALDIHSLSSSSGFRIDALLGYPFFLDHVISVDYPKREILIYRKHEAPICKSPIPIKIIDGAPVVVAKVKIPHSNEAETVHLVVDLGTRHYVAVFGGRFLNTKVAKTLIAHGHRQQIGTGTGGKIQGVATSLPELDVGGHHFHNLSVALTNQIKLFEINGFDGSLGVPLWKSGTLTFDYSSQRLCIETTHK